MCVGGDWLFVVGLLVLLGWYVGGNLCLVFFCGCVVFVGIVRDLFIVCGVF